MIYNHKNHNHLTSRRRKETQESEKQTEPNIATRISHKTPQNCCMDSPIVSTVFEKQANNYRNKSHPPYTFSSVFLQDGGSKPSAWRKLSYREYLKSTDREKGG
ncbi:hypothetical protein CEXT_125291 [Caerostris extrusa]|uniref:Uncharacterized protein n=1 Tax=Caerostris extrusa TaxID=172846 RepID=A0AAV4TDR0_CAEEX|nr:hypothetical protein CEXT_125291 [Caerostris extrusa]